MKQSDIKALAAFMSRPDNYNYICSSQNDTEKKKRIEQLRQKFLTSGTTSGNFSSVNFSADVEDVGNEEFSFMNDAEFDFAQYNKVAKANFGLSLVKNIVARHNVRESTKQYLTSRNEIIKRNKQRKAEAQKLRETI